MIANVEYAYPREYGLGKCAAHDYSLAPFCEDTNADTQTRSWCFDYWCYVDPSECNVATTRSAFFTNMVELHFSYVACGNINRFNADYYRPPPPSPPPPSPPPPSPACGRRRRW